MPFQKGVVTNPLGPLRSTRWKQALERSLARFGDGSIDAGLNKVADMVVQAAINGDMEAAKEIACRLDGRIPLPINADVTGDGRITIVHALRRTALDGPVSDDRRVIDVAPRRLESVPRSDPEAD